MSAGFALIIVFDGVRRKDSKHTGTGSFFQTRNRSDISPDSCHPLRFSLTGDIILHSYRKQVARQATFSLETTYTMEMHMEQKAMTARQATFSPETTSAFSSSERRQSGFSVIKLYTQNLIIQPLPSLLHYPTESAPLPLYLPDAFRKENLVQSAFSSESASVPDQLPCFCTRWPHSDTLLSRR